MKTPRKLQCDVRTISDTKQNNNEFESKYETIPQTAVTATKHIITTDTNTIIHRKLISKPLKNSFQNPLSRQRENARGPDGRFTQQTTFLPKNTSAEEEEGEEQQTENA